MSAPLKSPVLARTSSAASGFRFCGMIELPVVKASLSRIKPKASLDQMTTSSAKRDKCVPPSAAAARNSTAKSRSETAAIEFADGRPSGVQAARHRPDQLVDPRLDIEMDVLVLVAEDKAPRLDLAADLL